MKKIVLSLLIGLLSLSLVSDSLNLVELQKKEKKRRKKVVKSKYVLTNDKIIKFSLTKSKTFVEADVTATPNVTKTPEKKKSPDDRNTEEYWKGRINNLNKSIENLKNRITDTQSRLNLESSNYLIASTPSLQNQINSNIITLRNRLEKLKADLKQRELDKEAFLTEARKSGVLPGWLR